MAEQTGYQKRLMRAAMSRKSDRYRTNVRSEARKLKRKEGTGIYIELYYKRA